MGFFSRKKELIEENDKFKAESQANSLINQTNSFKYSLSNNYGYPISKEKKSEYNKTAYLKHKIKEIKKKQKENHNNSNKEICLSVTNNPLMSKEQYLRQQSQIRGIEI